MNTGHDLEALQRRGDVIGGGYVLGDIIGVGGMGVVYAATQRSLTRTVAIKLPRPELASDLAVRRRFHTEARAGSQVRHRNIVRVLDFGEGDNAPYLVMERIAGLGLAELLLEHGTLPVGAAGSLVGQILAGLEEAHRNGIVHGDVKTDNILVETQCDGGIVPKIIDFGISRFVGDDAAECSGGLVSGTPEYLAPELIRGAPPTYASDVYAVGVILYDLISGETPFAGGSSADVMNRQLDDDLVPLSWRCPNAGISAALDAVLARALAKQPGDRFVDAAAFRRALVVAHVQTSHLAIRYGSNRNSHPMMFSIEAVTATVHVDTPAPPHDADRLLEARQRAAADAIADGDADGIVVAYLDLARAHVDRHELPTAILALEHGIALLAVERTGPAWRLLLTLAALYDGTGNRSRAGTITRDAHAHAVRTGSVVGRERAAALLARLTRSRRPPW